MNARCTYADFLCLTSPLLVRVSAWRSDSWRLVLWWLAVLGFCVLRIAVACELKAQGVAWELGHDALDYAFRIVALLVVIFVFLERSLGKLTARRSLL